MKGHAHRRSQDLRTLSATLVPRVLAAAHRLAAANRLAGTNRLGAAHRLRPLAPGLALAAIACATLGSGCGTVHPRPLYESSLAEAQTFPYFRLYWVGPRFQGHPLAAVDGRESYNTAIGDSVYYGDCITGRGVLGGGGGCTLPLQVTTVIYRLHSNAPLGRQRNAFIRGVPATIYDEGRSIELYSGRLAIDVFSDTPAHALLAVAGLTPLNAPGSQGGRLPAPVYCPGLSGAAGPELQRAMQGLPGRPCQRARTALATLAPGGHSGAY